MNKSYTLVMAGGQGTRFWPESTSKRPKQYLSLLGNETLLSDTLKRYEGLVERDDRYIITVKEQEVLASKYSEGLIGEDGLIFEPSGRNTAPCILLGLLKLLESGAKREDIVYIAASDHVILNVTGFQETMRKASTLASSENSIVTIGIPPHFPHTGYGYIQKGKENGDRCYSVEEFKEKPDLETAKSYLKSGNYFWNSGMFVGTIGILLEEFEAHAPEIYSFSHLIKEELHEFSKLTLTYNKMPSDSIDYAIMEKSSKVMVVPAEFDWNDLGSWDALEAVIESHKDNTCVAMKDSYFQEAKGNIIFAPDKYVSLINVEDLIIISNDKNVVVLPKKDSQEIKKIVNHLKTSSDLKDLL